MAAMLKQVRVSEGWSRCHLCFGGGFWSRLTRLKKRGNTLYLHIQDRTTERAHQVENSSHFHTFTMKAGSSWTVGPSSPRGWNER